MFNSNFARGEAIVFTLLILISTALISIGLTGCSSKNDMTSALVQSMKEKGPLALSGNNPYLAPNEFVYRIRQESDSVRGFLYSRGIPDALVVSGSTLSADIIQLLYVAPYEAYTLEKIDERWIILGPQSFPHTHRVAVKRAVANRTSDPALLDAQTTPALSENPQKGEIQNSTLPTNGAYESELPDEKSETIAEIVPEQSPTNVAPVDATMDKVKELHKKFGTSDASRNAVGDIEHTVLSKEESLALLSLWYTADLANEGRIARINRRGTKSRLTPGDTLIIPRYLALTFKSFPSEAIPQLQALNSQ